MIDAGHICHRSLRRRRHRCCFVFLVYVKLQVKIMDK
jgi:hypothetical protein